MAIETVRVAFLSDDVVPKLLGGVLVRVFDAAGALVTSAMSGELTAGTAELELDGDAEGTIYLLRFFLFGAAIPPKRIRVFSPVTAAPGASNDFAVVCTVFRLDPAPDPLMCRCSGFILDPAGRPRPGVDITLRPKFYAFVNNARAAFTGQFVVRTDDKGYVQVDLYRRGMYEAVIEGQEPVTRHLEVPDKSAILIGHLLFPVVVFVDYLEPGPYSVARGETLLLTPTVRSTDYRNLGVAAEDVIYSIDDPTVASVQILGDRIAIRGQKAGTTNLRVTRRDRSIVYLPDLGIADGEVPLIVTA